ncbi:GAF domain-containing protein [Cellulomonas sp. GbtcB1]|uniref:GAF domain-containing protein n=1 Tax=Cellulomonas sp. GbtcB1 TaxID=2824746 RepID=UPI001C30B200|nr:GAF domain-containing protein [Cellulomonas sp. GbtcB1]
MAKGRDSVRGEWVFQWLLPVLAGGLAAGAPILWDLASEDTEGQFDSPWFYLFVIATLGALTLTIVQGVLSTRRASAVRRALSDFNHSLGDTILALGRLPDARNGVSARDAFVETVIREAKSIMPLPSPRVCVYELDSNDDAEGNGNAGPVEFLRLIKSGGRNDPPRNLFTVDDEHGRAAIANAKGNLPRCVEKPKKSRFQVQRDPEALWESFVLVPLKVDGRPRGMVTIDTTAKTTFTSDHVAVAMTIARFIEIGMKSLFDAAEETAPEVRTALAQLDQSKRDGEPDSASQLSPVESDGQEGGNDGNDR